MDADDLLVARLRQGGDEEAFAELVRRYRDPVFRLAVSILGQGFAGDAEEVAQEVFLRVHRSLASFRGDSQLGSWIYRITFNQALNLKARVRYRAPHVSDESLAATASPEADAHEQLRPATGPRPDRMHRRAARGLPVRFAAALLVGHQRQRDLGPAGRSGEHRQVLSPSRTTPAVCDAAGTGIQRCLSRNTWTVCCERR